MVGTLLPFGLAAGLLNINSLTILNHVSEGVLQKTRSPAPPPLVARGADTELLTPAIDAFIRETMELWDMRGAAIAIVRRRGDGGFDVSTRGYGVAARDGKPVTPDTLLPIGSNSKAFTVAAVGHLVANASVDLDWSSKVHQVLPEFQLQDEVATQYANLADIFSHRSGLPRYDFTFHDDGKLLEDFSLRTLKHYRPSAEFREATQYNNHMYNVGASIVSRLSGVRFQDFVRQQIFEAAGMNSSTYELRAAAADGRLAEGFVRSGENSTHPGTVHAALPHPIEEHVIAGAGAIASSANDIALWLQVLLNGGKSPQTGKQVVPAAALQQMERGITAYKRAVGPELGPMVYGMALASSSYQGHQYIEHGGSMIGYLSQIARFPNDGLGLAIFTNDSPRGAFAFEAIKWRIAEELLGMPLRVDWNTRFRQSYTLQLKAIEEVAKGRLPPPADAPPPSKPISDLVGTYCHPSYGSFEAVIKSDSKATLRAAFYDFVFLKYLDLTHYSGNVFNVTMTMPSGEAEDEAAGMLAEFTFADGEDGRVLGFGVGAGGGIWGSGEGVPPPQGKTPQETAEAWFYRVEDSGDAACVSSE